MPYLAQVVYQKFLEQAPLSPAELAKGLEHYKQLAHKLSQSGLGFEAAQAHANNVYEWLEQQR